MAKYFKSYIADSIWTTQERYWPTYFDIPFINSFRKFNKTKNYLLKGIFYGNFWEGINIRFT